MAESSVKEDPEPPFILRCGHAKVINFRKMKDCNVKVAFEEDWYIPGLAVVRHACQQKDCHQASSGNILATFCKLTDVDSNNILLFESFEYFKEEISMKGKLPASFILNTELCQFSLNTDPEYK